MLGVMWICSLVPAHRGWCVQLIKSKTRLKPAIPTLPCPDEEVVCFAPSDVQVNIWKIPLLPQPGDALHCDDGALLWGKVHLQILAGLGSCIIFCPEGCPFKHRKVWQVVAAGMRPLVVVVKVVSQSALNLPSLL